MTGRIIPTILGKEQVLIRVASLSTVLPLMINLRTVMALVGVSFSIC